MKSVCHKWCPLLYIIHVLILMSSSEAVYPNKLEVTSKNSQATHKPAKIILFIKRISEATVTADLFEVLAETLLEIMIGPSCLQ